MKKSWYRLINLVALANAKTKEEEQAATTYHESLRDAHVAAPSGLVWKKFNEEGKISYTAAINDTPVYLIDEGTKPA